jgi:PKD repeat protein
VDQTASVRFWAISWTGEKICGRAAGSAVSCLPTGVIRVRKYLSMLLFVVLVTTGVSMWAPAAQAADTGNAAPQPGRIVSDEPATQTPDILDGTVYSIAKVGNTVVVGGQFTQVQNANTSATLTRVGVLAFDATSGQVSTAFAPNPQGIVYKVLPAADGKSVYVAGSFTSAAGQSMPGRIFKINVSTGVVDPTFVAPPISGDIRDLELVGNHLFVAGKMTHFNGIPQKALGTIYADTGKRDTYFNSVFAGTHRTGVAGDVTDVLQISVNKQNTQLMAVGNFTSVDGQARSQIAKFDISNVGSAPADPNAHQSLSTWSTNQFTAGCSSKFDTYMTDVEYSPDGSYFIVSTTGAWGGSQSNSGTIGCDGVFRFEAAGNAAATPNTWSAYTGGDTTWTVEITNNVVYTGGHMRWQNNPSAGDTAGQGAVSREGIAALNPVNGMPYSWNPTRARGVGIQDMLATPEGLYVGSDTELIGHTTGNTYHARIALMPLAGGNKLPQLQTNNLPVDLYRVATGGSQLVKNANFTGTTAAGAVNVPTGPGWGTSVGAFMVNGVLYKANNDGTLSAMTFDGTNYGTATAVNTADALVVQTDWHTDVKTITSLFYANGFMYYTKSGTNALYRRGFEVEDGVVGQQRFSTTTSGINWGTVRGAFVAGGKLYYVTSTGALWGATWNQAGHAPTSAGSQIGASGWGSRAIFPMQTDPGPVNDAPVANASITCSQLQCSYDATASVDPEGGPLTYDWDFGDGTAHGTSATATHTYSSAGDRAVTLVVTDNKGATNAVTRNASPLDYADSISFVNKNNNNGNRSAHTITVPSGTQIGDTMLLFFSANSTTPTFTGPTGWTEVLSENGGSTQMGKLYSKTATAFDVPGTQVTVTTKNADGTAALVKDDMTLAVYRGNGTPPVASAASGTQSVSTIVHQTPTLNASNGNGWLLSYWSDKGSTTTSWTGPASQAQRSMGTATGTGHVSSLLMDSNGRVSTGGQGGLNATANPSSKNSGITMSVLLSGQGAPAPNQPPVAHAALVGCTGMTCSFDGGSSSDPEGGALTYDWNWGDGTAHGTTATASHTFASGGTPSVTLTVTDPKGATGTDSVTATPTDPPPNGAPTAHITSTGCTNLTCSPNGASSTDPDNDTLTYDWDWGDTTAHSTTANPTHTYATSGARTVTLTVDDGHGHTATDTATLNPTDPPNTAPTARITNASCSNLACSFTGSTSSDPENDTLTYSWNFGDSATSTDTNPSHTYATSGAKSVSLTVDDGHGNTNTATTTVTPTDPGTSHIAFVGSAGTSGNRTTATVTLPSGVQVGDQMVLFFGSASITPTYTGPAGWTEIENKNGSSAMAIRVYTRTATAADTVANTKVNVVGSVIAKSDLTVSVYRSTDGTTPIAASASKIDNAAGASHTSPAVTAADSTSWLITYWADRSNTSTTIAAPTGPNAPTVRMQGLPSDTGSAHTVALLADSNGPVASGAQGQLTAVANGDSSRGASASILLKSN